MPIAQWLYVNGPQSLRPHKFQELTEPVAQVAAAFGCQVSVRQSSLDAK